MRSIPEKESALTFPFRAFGFQNIASLKPIATFTSGNFGTLWRKRSESFPVNFSTVSNSVFSFFLLSQLILQAEEGQQMILKPQLAWTRGTDSCLSHSRSCERNRQTKFEISSHISPSLKISDDVPAHPTYAFSFHFFHSEFYSS